MAKLRVAVQIYSSTPLIRFCASQEHAPGYGLFVPSLGNFPLPSFPCKFPQLSRWPKEFSGRINPKIYQTKYRSGSYLLAPAFPFTGRINVRAFFPTNTCTQNCFKISVDLYSWPVVTLAQIALLLACVSPSHPLNFLALLVYNSWSDTRLHWIQTSVVRVHLSSYTAKRCRQP